MISKGRLAVICNEKSGVSKASGKDWKSLTFVITTDDQYNPNLAFTTSNLVDVVKAIPIGAEVEVEWNPSSREYNGNWYSEFKAWKITQVGAAPVAPPLTSDTTDESQLPF